MNTHKLKRYAALIGTTTVALYAALCFTACSDKPEDHEPPAWASNFALPNAQAAHDRLLEIYGAEQNIFLLNANIARMPCPENGETVTFDFTYDVGAYAKLVIEDCIAEFNEVFAVVNPNYKFAANYAPTDADLEQEYSVRMSHAETINVTESSFALGMAHVSYYNGFTTLGDFGITLKDEVLTNGSYLMTTFKHEFMHLLGAGDAYKNSNATKATVMQSYTVNGYHYFSSTDVAFIDALYRNPDAPYSDEYIKAYITDYEQNTTHTRDNMTAVVYKTLIANTDAHALAAQTDAIGYADAAEFKTTIANGIKPDTAFGSADISFTELEYVERPDETYFGSFDVADRKYWHGRDKGTLQTTMGIGYTDFGGGVLYALPNGTYYRTLFVRQGKFVLALHLDGSFTSLDELALSVWHVCTTNA